MRVRERGSDEPVLDGLEKEVASVGVFSNVFEG